MLRGNFIFVKFPSKDIIKVIVKVIHLNRRDWITKENGVNMILCQSSDLVNVGNCWSWPKKMLCTAKPCLMRN